MKQLKIMKWCSNTNKGDVSEMKKGDGNMDWLWKVLLGLLAAGAVFYLILLITRG